ncbi:hypothetical protein SanaruYs_08850 [Chryseotalea sanaruensis]|uniref:DUF4252 domain-containing protein n=1 Tax=Chryseotalea sanaruensis TaxID=2482724 RepID=A0A401U703_9BACT|nr:DUF6624 domain-containing protein [Chryseotalea sanaruensis]GCC50667.1 hypothetical protein SanaruYs_08850 [Chryseotalea sanaruensis]
MKVRLIVYKFIRTRTTVLFCLHFLILTETFAQSTLNDSLITQLHLIREDDQKYRAQLESIQTNYGWESKEMKDLWKIIEKKDSLNLIKIEAILGKYGWLGSEIIGESGNSTLFLVIQHSDIETQVKYLPMMRDAVKNGKAKASSLALLEDRVALRLGNKQIYGSQVSWNMKTNEYYILPLDDPDNVDKRRAAVGLQPLGDYVSNWNLKWDIEQYKKDLPKIEALQKKEK